MARRLTTEEWVERAKSIWGDTYDYSEVEYVDAKTKVWIICKKESHGGWPANPDGHISRQRRRGCPKCGGSQRKTFEEFKEQAIKVHGDIYSYPKQIYKNAHTEVLIFCPVHGSFPKSPDAHLRGQGCPVCSNESSGAQRLLTEDEVNSRLLEKCTGDLPKVRLVSDAYKGMNYKASIICEVHGKQAPRFMTSVFSSPHPCLICSQPLYARKRSTEDFLKILKRKFGGLYQILGFSYEGKETVIPFVCKEDNHGPFSIQAGNIYRSPGCPKCAYKNSVSARQKALIEHIEKTRVKREAEWLEKAKAVHGNKFDYSQVVYKDQRTHVLIGCQIHGLRSQTPSTHLTSGCRLCADEDLKGLYSERYFEQHPNEKLMAGMLYYVRFRCDDEEFYKVGITKNTVKDRFSAIPKDIVSLEILGTKKTSIYDAWKTETEIQSTHGEQFRYRPLLGGVEPREYRIGPSECFSNALSKQLVEKYFGKASNRK